MNIKKHLKTLKLMQGNLEDVYRIYPDGSIRTATLTESMNRGWYALAKPLPGAAHKYKGLFGSEFLKVGSMREAIDLRDKMAPSAKPIEAEYSESKCSESDSLPILL